ncbi:MAG: LPS export ABC transporter permease LptG, partial [Gammaproteobacteria bacterium]|nr:LPS export ABC transporter permease LptG [Gammaproteobacteria bacterium]
MRILDQYLMKQISMGIVISTMVLIPLFSFLDLVEQLDDVGTGFYQTKDAFIYVLLTIPRRFIQLAPFIALMGNVTALGRLAIHLELISLRSAGFSPLDISSASLKVGFLLVLLIIVLEFLVAPTLQQRAIAFRAAALDQSTIAGSDLGIWSRNNQHIIRIENLQHDTATAGVEIINLDEDGSVSEYISAEGFEIVSDDEWILYNVTSKLILDDEIISSRTNSMLWETFLEPDQISTLTKQPESLSPIELYNYIEYLDNTGQESDVYELTLWRKPGEVLTMLGMLLLSVPFVIGSVRTGFANRLVMAGVTGIVVYLLDQIFSNAGLLLNLNPLLVALAPGTTLIWASRLW